MQNFSFLARLEVAEKFVVVGVVGWGVGGSPGQVYGSALVKLNKNRQKNPGQKDIGLMQKIVRGEDMC